MAFNNEFPPNVRIHIYIYTNQDERAPDITSSSAYIPLSDDYPTPQDTVGHDGVYVPTVKWLNLAVPH